jgi:integrase/recombinase XerD
VSFRIGYLYNVIILILALMKKKIVLKRLYHRDHWRLVFVCDWDESLVSIIRKINGNRYSKTYKYWYADDNEETLKQILQAFRDKADIDISALVYKPDRDESEHPEINIEIVDPVPEINSVSQKPDNEDTETEMIPARSTIEKVMDRSRFGPVEFRINEKDGRLAIRFTGNYDPEWIDEIRDYRKFYHDKSLNEFLLPWSVMTGDSLSDYFSSRGVEVKIIKSVASESLKSIRRGLGDEIRGRELGEKAYEGLELMRKHLDEVRYSSRTNESYLALLNLFFKYFHEKEPLKITREEVSHFIHDFIITNGYSSSYQNQMISAIKTFYKISGRSRFELQLFERPRRSRALPKVFSKDEVKRILNATKNNKHKLLLWIIYSCGLRRSEIINIRLTDLDRDRGLLHIREGKGRVDRIVPVSMKVWEKLDEYIDGFDPKKYLFEGQSGDRYSAESVYRVFKQALQKAGIDKEVGVHSLRHSYATHLHESGLDIRYIQELLGHKSTRTTEIYTHVSRRNLVAVRSPIEDLDVK